MFFYKQKFFKKSFISLFAFASIFVCLMNPSDVMAVNGDILPNVAKTHNIEDENVQSGDIISYNNEINTYTLSKSVSSKRMFGVVAENPLLVFEYDEEGVPVLKSGALKVNVLLKEGEEIKQGDLITSSSFPGKGKSVGSEDFYVLGASKENVSFDSSIAPVISYGGEDIKISKVGVDVDIGPRPETSFHTQTGGAGKSNETTSTKIIQYAIAGFIVLSSLFIAFRKFMPNLQKGITSMGRSSRAKGVIKSMIIYDGVVAFLIVLLGFLAGFMIIWLPI